MEDQLLRLVLNDDRRDRDTLLAEARGHVQVCAAHRPTLLRESRDRAAGMADDAAVTVAAGDHLPARATLRLAGADSRQPLAGRVPVTDQAVGAGAKHRCSGAQL